jgi:hypothetical protein
VSTLLSALRTPQKADGSRIVAIKRGEEHQAIYKTIIEMIQQVDLAVVGADYAFRPALD